MKEHLTFRTMVAMVVAVIGLAIASPARAQERLAAYVPFDFVVGQTHFSPGKYVVSKTSTPAVLSIQSADRRHHALFLTNADGGKAPAQPELVFKRYEGQLFLARINDGYGIQREMPLSPSIMNRADRIAAATVTVPLRVQ